MKHVVDVARAMGREIATPAEAREILPMPNPDPNPNPNPNPKPNPKPNPNEAHTDGLRKKLAANLKLKRSNSG